MKNQIYINKLGGKTLNTRKKVNLSLRFIKKQIKQGKKPVIVISALDGVTDSLINIVETLRKSRKKTCFSQQTIEKYVEKMELEHRNLLKSFNLKLEQELDIENAIKKIINNLYDDLEAICKFGMIDIIEAKILSYGEKMMATLYSMILKIKKIETKYITAEQLGIITDSEFLDADIQFLKAKKNIKKQLKKIDKVLVIPGFVGVTEENQTTVLGRGGADTTATFLGAVLDAEKVILWTENKGVMSADPKVVEKAITIPIINYIEAEESGQFICSKAVQYIKIKNTPCEVVNIEDQSIKTKIINKKLKEEGVKMIGSKNNLILVKLKDKSMEKYGFLFRVSQVFNKYKINMVLIRNTRESMYIVIEKDKGKFITEAINEIKKNQIEVENMHVSMITMIGSISWRQVSEFNELLRKINGNAVLGAFPYKGCIRLEAIATIVKKQKLNELINLVHQRFIEL